MSGKSVFALLALLVLCGGCRMGAGMHAWSPPELESAVGKRVGIAPMGGQEELAGPIHTKMIAMAPRDAGREITAVDPGKQNTASEIRQVSAIENEPIEKTPDDVIQRAINGQPNDITTAAIARSAGVDYLMRGQVLTTRHKDLKPAPVDVVKEMFAAETDKQVKDENPQLSVSWQLTSIADGRHAGGKPVVVDLKTAKSLYPDLAMLSDADEILSTASVREAYRLVTPSVKQHRVQLAIPYAMPGSREVRRGNVLALNGKWGEAEKVWQAVADRHPLQAAALHNLALAAAASQDFSRAKALARKAVRRNPAPLHQKTAVWIEQRQREYHKAFGLPDPPEGWFVSRD